MLTSGELYEKCRNAFSSYGMVCEPLAANFEMIGESTPRLVDLTPDMIALSARSIQEIIFLLFSANVSGNCVLDFSYIESPEYFSGLVEMFKLTLTGGEPNDDCLDGIISVCVNNSSLKEDSKRSLDLLNKLVIKCMIEGELATSKVISEGIVQQYVLYRNNKVV